MGATFSFALARAGRKAEGCLGNFLKIFAIGVDT